MDFNSDKKDTNQPPQIDGSENLRQLAAYHHSKGRKTSNGATQPTGGTYQWFLLAAIIIGVLGFLITRTDAYQTFLDEIESSQQPTQQSEPSPETSNSENNENLLDDLTPREEVVAAVSGLSFDVIWYHVENPGIELLSQENFELVYASYSYDYYIHPTLQANYELTAADEPDEGVIRLSEGFCPDEDPYTNEAVINATSIIPSGEPFCMSREVFDESFLDS